LPPASLRRHPPAGVEHQQQIIDRPVFEAVGQIDLVTDQLIALRVEHDDVAGRLHLTGLAVPHHPIGGEVIAVTGEPYRSAGTDHFATIVIGQVVGGEVE
jgi:hypothetical protein